ncbi:MAG: response regulator [Terracidiphilus sp.]
MGFAYLPVAPESAPSPAAHVTPIVFVVDDDVSVRESLDLLIRCEGWQPEIFPSALEFLSHPRARVPSCLVLDISLPDLSGLELQKRMAVERADMPIIFITGHGDVPTTVRAMKAGAVEFLTKPFSGDVLLSAMRQALERSRIALYREMELHALQDCYESLTSRERQVLALVVSGMLNKQVGNELGISEITVKAHRGKVMEKMKADSLADLVRIAARLRLPRAPRQLLPLQNFRAIDKNRAQSRMALYCAGGPARLHEAMMAAEA